MSNDEENPDTPESIAVGLEEFIELVDDGQFSADLMKRVQQVVKGVRETGGNGRVDLRFKIETAGAGQVEITPVLKSKEPKSSHAIRVLYADDEGHLYREDPHQASLPFRSPQGADAKTKDSVNKN